MSQWEKTQQETWELPVTFCCRGKHQAYITPEVWMEWTIWWMNEWMLEGEGKHGDEWWVMQSVVFWSIYEKQEVLIRTWRRAWMRGKWNLCGIYWNINYTWGKLRRLSVFWPGGDEKRRKVKQDDWEYAFCHITGKTCWLFCLMSIII